MPSSYTSSLRLEMPADGEQQNTWGDTVNRTLTLIDFAIGGITTVNTSGGSLSLTANNGLADQARASILQLEGSLTANLGLTLPACSRPIMLRNLLTANGFTIDLATPDGIGISLPGDWGGVLFTDGGAVDFLTTISGVRSIGVLGSVFTTGGINPVGNGLPGVAMNAESVQINSTDGVTSPLYVGFAGAGNLAAFYNGSTADAVGSISSNGASTSYNTTSDYRAKERLTPLRGATELLRRLPVYRGAYRAQPERLVHMMLAHEVAAVVPEAVTGEKDATDGVGAPRLQQLDASKLIPMLVGACQELEARVFSLEAAGPAARFNPASLPRWVRRLIGRFDALLGR